MAVPNNKALNVGSVLEARNKDVVQKLDDLKTKRTELQKDIQSSELHKIELEQHIQLVRNRIAQIKVSLASKTEMRGEYAQLVDQIDEAYNSILNESQSLISHLDLNTTRITDALAAKPQPIPSSSSREQEPPALLLQQTYHSAPPPSTNGTDDHYSAPASTAHAAPAPFGSKIAAGAAAPAQAASDDAALVAALEEPLPAAAEKQVTALPAASDVAADKQDQQVAV